MVMETIMIPWLENTAIQTETLSKLTQDLNLHIHIFQVADFPKTKFVDIMHG